MFPLTVLSISFHFWTPVFLHCMCFTLHHLTRKSKNGLNNNLGLSAKLNTKGGNQLVPFGSETIQPSWDLIKRVAIQYLKNPSEEPDFKVH